MAADPDFDTTAPWPDHVLNTYPFSPSASSTKSTSSSVSSSAFSIDAPSSQSSVASTSVIWTNCHNESEAPYNEHTTSRTFQQNDYTSKENLCPNASCNLPPQQSYTKFAALEARQHPRRTQRLHFSDAQGGKSTTQCPRPPPTLVRQSERKVNFVDSLVDTTTQMVETIWPLSAYVQSRHAVMCARKPSKMDLRYFIQEVLRRSKTSYSTLQVALYYLILLRSCLPNLDFTMEQPEDSACSFSLQCGRRMFIAALILASKYLQDRNFSANAWSKISGLSTWDLNVNEMAFLSVINWKLHIPAHVFHRWTDIVLKYSPSAQVNVPPRSSPKPVYTWKEVVSRLTPELDTIDFGSAEVSDDSGYDSPGSVMSPPPVPIRIDACCGSNERTPTPSNTVPRWLENTPSIQKAQGTTLPPLPRLALAPLPTPEMTPHTGPYCTPAVSTSGVFSRRPSMSDAMCQIRDASFARSTLDKTAEWQPRLSEPCSQLPRRTSLAASASSMSSPESLISDVCSQFSDSSARPSRSSSISSVASSNCAPGQPTRLAVQVTRRCANMQLNGVKEETHASGLCESPKGMSFLEFQGRTGANAPHLTKSMKDTLRMVGLPGPGYASRTTGLPQVPLCPIHKSKMSRKLPDSFDASQNADTREAATALQELALSRQHSQAARPRSTDSRKRTRPNSIDLSVEDAVRNLIAPRCLNDITNKQQRNEDASTAIPDDQVADSFLLRKENKHVVRESKKATKPSVLREGPSRKRTCAGSDRGGREEARMMERLVQQGRGPGMWGGVV
ncbi:MAG: hypothetical protein Q9217_006752 [Psora testacea]